MNISSLSNATLNAVYTNLMDTNKDLTKATSRLAEGRRTISSSDDAAGVSVATRMKTDLVSEKQAGRNINDAISLVQTAEGGITQQINSLIRLRELQVQVMNETYTSADIDNISTEMSSIINEVFRIAETNNFNEIYLLNRNGNQTPIAFDGVLSFQVGVDSDHVIEFDIDNIHSDRSSTITNLRTAISNGGATGTGFFASFSSSIRRTFKGQQLDAIDLAISRFSESRAHLGSLQNRLEVAMAESQTKAINTTATHRSIVDANMAEEVTKQTQLTIRKDAGIAALAQAKSMSESVVSLLR